MRITLNLATRPYIDLRPAIKRLRIAMAVLAVIAIGLGLGLRALHQKAEAARATEQRLQNKIDAISRERQGYQDLMHRPENALLLTQAAALNQLFDEKTFSWTLAMEDLETVLPGGVQVTAIEPVRDVKTGIITLKLRVVGPRDRAVDLVQNLERSRYFLRPSIVGESVESNGGPGERLQPVSASTRVNFDLLADYNSAALAEHRTRNKTAKPEAGRDEPRQSAPPLRAVVHPSKPSAAQVPAPVSPAFTPSNRPPMNANPVANRSLNRMPAPNPNQGGPR
ncbi:MAG: fimbrial assembly protein [Terracidiphilus sp.]